MRALLYLRKSTDEHQLDSISTQRENATKFAVENGWDVADEIVDEGESRAEFKKRPGFSRLLVLASQKPRAFDVLVVRDESRLGAGERLVVALDDILAAGVQIFYYASGKRVTLDSATDKLTHAVLAIVAEMERAKTAERTREALKVKAARGLNAGGRCFGYDNVRTVDADGRSRTDYKIHPQQAAVVVDICERYASGLSERSIAKALNVEGVASPTAGKRGTGSWSPNAIREIVRRPRYRGQLVWGKLGAEYRGGTRVRTHKTGSELVTVTREDLRIISPDLDARIAARIAKLDAIYQDRKVGEGRAPRYLLSGKSISRCGDCGGPMQVGNTQQGSGAARKRGRAYVCAWRRDRGASVCSNDRRKLIEDVDRHVVGWVLDVALSDQVVGAILKTVRQRLTQTVDRREGVADIRLAEIAKLEKEISRLTKVAAFSEEQPEELAHELDTRSRRLRELRAEKAAEHAAPVAIASQLEALEADVRSYAASLRCSLGQLPEQARRVVETLFDGPLTFSPIESGAIEVTGRVSPGHLFHYSSDPTGSLGK